MSRATTTLYFVPPCSTKALSYSRLWLSNIPTTALCPAPSLPQSCLKISSSFCSLNFQSTDVLLKIGTRVKLNWNKKNFWHKKLSECSPHQMRSTSLFKQEMFSWNCRYLVSQSKRFLKLVLAKVKENEQVTKLLFNICDKVYPERKWSCW